MRNPLVPSVASVMAGFTKTVANLRAVAEHRKGVIEKNNAKADKLLDKLDVVTQRNLDAQAEQQSALALADKIEEQFGLK